MCVCLFVDSPSLSGGLGTMRTSLTTVIATVTVTVTVTAGGIASAAGPRWTPGAS